MMTTNLFVIANVKQLPLFRRSWGVGVLNSAIFSSFHNSGWVWHNIGRPSEFRGGFEHPNPPPRYATGSHQQQFYAFCLGVFGGRIISRGLRFLVRQM